MTMLWVLACGPGQQDDAVVEAAVTQFGVDPVFTELASSDDKLRQPRDLGFNTAAVNDLWVVNRENDAVVILREATTGVSKAERLIDCAANHFMEEVSAIAFGPDGMFGTAQESDNTYDDQAPPNGFMGPALWTADPTVFAEVNQSCTVAANGSHLDMLHQSPFGMGMAWDQDNAYWYFDGENGHLVWYDFQDPHGPGEDDHSDGLVRRYPEVALDRKPDVPGHMEMDHTTGLLYVANTAAGKLLVVDTGTGDVTDTLTTFLEPLEEYSEVTGVDFDRWDLDIRWPSGVALADGLVFVGDYETGAILALDAATGEEVDRVLSPSGKGLMGLEVGPDGRLYYVDEDDETVGVIDAG